MTSEIYYFRGAELGGAGGGVPTAGTSGTAGTAGITGTAGTEDGGDTTRGDGEEGGRGVNWGDTL